MVDLLPSDDSHKVIKYINTKLELYIQSRNYRKDSREYAEQAILGESKEIFA